MDWPPKAISRWLWRQSHKEWDLLNRATPTKNPLGFFVFSFKKNTEKTAKKLKTKLSCSMCPSLMFHRHQKKVKERWGGELWNSVLPTCFFLNIFHLSKLKPPTLSGMIFCKCDENNDLFRVESRRIQRYGALTLFWKRKDHEEKECTIRWVQFASTNHPRFQSLPGWLHF